MSMMILLMIQKTLRKILDEIIIFGLKTQGGYTKEVNSSDLGKYIDECIALPGIENIDISAESEAFNNKVKEFENEITESEQNDEYEK